MYSIALKCFELSFMTDLFQDGFSKFQRMPCMAHTLQLAVKDALKVPSASNVLRKARSIVHAIWKSSVANERMIQRYGLCFIFNFLTLTHPQTGIYGL